jgi:hypothetical protein
MRRLPRVSEQLLYVLDLDDGPAVSSALHAQGELLHPSVDVEGDGDGRLVSSDLQPSRASRVPHRPDLLAKPGVAEARLDGLSPGQGCKPLACFCSYRRNTVP